MADWLKILEEQTRVGAAMEREVPQVLANPGIETAQVKSLFDALESQAQFAEQLKLALEKLGHDFDVVDAAEALIDRYGDLAARVGAKLQALHRKDKASPVQRDGGSGFRRM